MSQISFTNVNDMITDSFGDEKTNQVNFKLISGVLFILAKEMHLLERKFYVETELNADIPSPQISVTEIRFETQKAKELNKILAKTPTQVDKEMAQVEKETSVTDIGSEAYKAKKQTEKGVGTAKEPTQISKEMARDASMAKPGKPPPSLPVKPKREKPASVETEKSYKKSSSASSLQSLSDEVSTESTTSGKSSRSQISSTTKVKQEKILILETGVSGLPSDTTSSQRLSLATKEQFETLMKSVAELSQQYSVSDNKELNEILDQSSKFYKKASLTEPMAALQLAARLEIVERSADLIIKLLIGMNQDIPKATPEQPELKKADPDEKDEEDPEKDEFDDTETKVEQEATLEGPETQSEELDAEEHSEKIKEQTGTFKKTDIVDGSTTAKPETPPAHPQNVIKEPAEDVHDIETERLESPSKMSAETGTGPTTVQFQVEPEKLVSHMKMQADDSDSMRTDKSFLTRKDFEMMLQDFSFDVNTKVQATLNKFRAQASRLSQKSTASGKLVIQALDLSISMAEIEEAVSIYAEHSARLDTCLAAKMTEYQELLSLMVYDLESGIDVMMEVITSLTGPSSEMKDLHKHFGNFELMEDDLATFQGYLKDEEDTFRRILDHLKKDVEVIENVKTTIQEVEEQIEGKAGVKDINEKTGKDYFFAVKGDLEKRIRATYEKFNTHEYSWQKLLDDLTRNFNKRAEKEQLDKLFEDIRSHTEKLEYRLKAVATILGGPRQQQAGKQIISEFRCLSCAYGDIEENKVINPKLSKESALQKESSDLSEPLQSVCYPGYQIAHPLYPRRSRICLQVCGGDPNTHDDLTSILPAIAVKKLDPRSKDVSEMTRKMCLRCNKNGSKDGINYQKALKHRASPEIQQAPVVTSPVKDPASDLSFHIIKPSMVQIWI